MTEALIISLGVILALYLGFAAVLLLAGRRAEATALARFIPDCLVLFRRLLGDPRIPRRRKLALGATALYLASPIDLVPDFIPVLGVLDDALLVGLVLRYVSRGGGPDLLREHWPGPEESLAVVERAVYGRAGAADGEA